MLNRHRPCHRVCVFGSARFCSEFCLRARSLRTVTVFFEFFVLFCVLRCFSVPMAGSMSKCARLTRSKQLRFVAKIHVSMCRFPYIGKCCSELSRVVGKDRDATWLRGAYQNIYLSLYVRQRYIWVNIQFKGHLVSFGYSERIYALCGSEFF